MFWRRPELMQEFVGYVEPMMRNNDLLMRTIQRANDLGLRGVKVKVLEKRSVLRPDDILLSSVWFIGEKQ